VAPEGALDPALSSVLRAFQRHWRPEAVTGQADAGTLVRLLAVARLCAEGADELAGPGDSR
jgi:N-acetylmuramoyl-L-alanine amidase